MRRQPLACRQSVAGSRGLSQHPAPIVHVQARPEARLPPAYTHTNTADDKTLIEDGAGGAGGWVKGPGAASSTPYPTPQESIWRL